MLLLVQVTNETIVCWEAAVMHLGLIPPDHPTLVTSENTA